MPESKERRQPLVHGRLFIYESKDQRSKAAGKPFRGVLFNYATPPTKYDGATPQEVTEKAQKYMEQVRSTFFEDGIEHVDEIDLEA